jgi:uncharacterized protein YjbI with pentapeptide repeats
MKLAILRTIVRYATLSLVICAIAFGAAPDAIAANPVQIQQLLETNHCPGCDLVGANLQGKDLHNANLVDANLRGAILSQANLHQANLVGAELTGADVTGTNLSQANLLEAKLSGVNLNQADTRDTKLSRNNLLKDNLQLVQLLVAIVGSILATVFIVPQYLENQKWRVYEFTAREVKEFETRQETINVMRMLDSEDRNVKLFPDAEESKNKFVLVKKQGLCEALSSPEDRELDEDIHRPRKADQSYINAAIRDNFDRVLDNLERFNNLIESKVITTEGLKSYIDAWLELIHSSTDFEVRKKLWLYIEKRNYSGVQKLFKRYGRSIYPQPDRENNEKLPASNLELVVTEQLSQQK